MEHAKTILSFIPSIVTSSLFLVLALWKADVWISDAGAKRLYGAISRAVSTPQDSEIRNTLESLLDHYFSPDNGWLKFLKNVFILTLTSLIFLLGIYVTKTPSLVEQIFSTGFLSQFFGNGFVVTFFVNCFIFSQYKRLIKSFVSGSVIHNIALIGLDIVLKSIIFIILTLFTYYVFVLAFDSFGGDIRSVPKVAATTILHAVRFQSLTSVYLYSLVLSSFPIFVIVLIKLMLFSTTFAKLVQAFFFWLPFEGKPLRAISVVFSVLAAIFALAFSLLLSWGTQIS